MEVAAYQHGIFPRSEAVVAATRDLERGRATADNVVTAFVDDRAAYVRLQFESGLDFHSDGLLRWADLFRPLVEATDGLTADGLVRWFDNNSFYRAPHVDGPLAPTRPPEVFADLEDVTEPRVATLPSPYLFAKAVHGATDLSIELAESVLRPAAVTLRDRGCRVIHLEEPWIGFHGIQQSEWDSFEKAIGALTDGLEVATVLHVYYGDASPHLDRLRRMPVTAVGVDLVETDVDALGDRWETGLLAGCINGRTTFLEDAGAASTLVLRAAEITGAPSVFVSSNSELELLPLEAAKAKVHLLGEVAGRVKGGLV